MASLIRIGSGLRRATGAPLLLLPILLSIFVAASSAACADRQPAATATPRVQPAVTDLPVTPAKQPGAVGEASSTRREPVPPEAVETLHSLESIEMPRRDPSDLTRRFKDPGRPIPQEIRDEPWGFAIGHPRRFWILDWDNHTYNQVTATLSYQTTHVNVFIQDGAALDEIELKQLVDRFEEQTYPATRQFFGQEWSPGVDGDPRLALLVGGPYGSYISGYQHSQDEYSTLIYPYSNEMEIIYITPASVVRGDDCLLAHEYTHLIQWATDRYEATWINEGMAELACQVNGYVSPVMEIVLPAFAGQPDVQLNTWSGEMDLAAARFGASALFMAYFRDRFGDQAVQALAAEPESGLDGVAATLASVDAGLSLKEFFADWVVANLINDPALMGGRYGYSERQPLPIDAAAEYGLADLPVRQQAEVSQYAADYIVLRGPGAFQVDFAGTALVRLAPAPDHNGRYAWWGGRGQERDATLTHEFDLTGIEQAVLLFDTWYDIDEDYDYAYVAASTDGQRWTTLPGRTTTENDPNGANYGHGFTGQSAGWIEEQMDLAPYAGQKVQIRFEYVTDDGPVNNGIFIDDIRIPELNFYDNVEAGEGEWAPRGFIRLANVIPQEWLLQLVAEKGGQTTVEQLLLGPDNAGRWAVTLQEGETATLVVSGISRVTTEPAGYAYAITAGNR